MGNRSFVESGVLACVLAAVSGGAFAADVSTVASGAWNDPDVWSLGRTPAAGDDVTVTHDLLLASPTPRLASFAIAGATLTFTNWTTCLAADSVTLSSGSAFTIPGPFETDAESSRVNVECVDFTLAQGAVIDMAGKGYAGGTQNQSWIPAFGPGGGAYGKFNGSGGAHGGIGGNAYNDGGVGTGQAPAYDSRTAPVLAGSGGSGSWFNSGRPGGGAVRIDATGAVTINGRILANGLSSTGGSSGAGAGGSVYVTCATFGGSDDALIDVSGGDSVSASDGGGGGGLAFIGFDPVAQASAPAQHVPIDASAGTGGYQGLVAGNGYVGFSHYSLLDFSNVPYNGIVELSDVSLSASSMSLDSGWLVFSSSNAHLEVTGPLSISGPSTRLAMANGATLSCGSLAMSDGASIAFDASLPDDGSSAYGALVEVDGAAVVGTNSWIFVSRGDTATNGAALRLAADSISILFGGGIDADGQGYPGGSVTGSDQYNQGLPASLLYGLGPGGGPYGKFGAGGAGHAGPGGIGNGDGAKAPGGLAYDDIHAPLIPGSGGASTWYSIGAPGGGAIHAIANDAIYLEGTITADGEGNGGGSGGSGGAIYLECSTFDGTDYGLLSAFGGRGVTGGSGAGSGGLVYVDFDPVAQAAVGSVPVAAGVSRGVPSYAGDTGNGILCYASSIGYDAERFPYAGTVMIEDESWSAESLAVTTCTLRMSHPGAVLSIAGPVVVDGASARVEIPNGGTLAAGSIAILGGGTLALDATLPDDASEPYGALVSATGSVVVAADSWILANRAAGATNGAAVRIEARDLAIDFGGGIDASFQGYPGGTIVGVDYNNSIYWADGVMHSTLDPALLNGFGPGAGSYGKFGGGGASHGGLGGDSYNDYGAHATPSPVYDDAESPGLPGSGGGSSWGAVGAAGGGAIDMRVANNAVVNGSILADGEDPRVYSVYSNGGGGSGGAINLVCKRLFGDGTATFSAKGGSTTVNCGNASGAGGGGGGRIAIAARIDGVTGLEPGLYTAFDPADSAPSCDISVSGGEGAGTPRETNEGEAYYELYTESVAGTVFIRRFAPEGTTLILK